MNCPNCGSPMRRGVAEIRGRLIYALLVYGISYQPLWWKADGEERQMMMVPRSPREAFRCANCSTLVFDAASASAFAAPATPGSQ
jgi:hypothetical protein